MTAVFIDAFRSSYGNPGSPMGPPRQASFLPGPAPLRRPAPAPTRQRQPPRIARRPSGPVDSQIRENPPQPTRAPRRRPPPVRVGWHPATPPLGRNQRLRHRPHGMH
ncbi:uncharacterized protein LOC142769161 isoform X2 [Rhipicephalus microplus]